MLNRAIVIIRLSNSLSILAFASFMHTEKKKILLKDKIKKNDFPAYFNVQMEGDWVHHHAFVYFAPCFIESFMILKVQTLLRINCSGNGKAKGSLLTVEWLIYPYHLWPNMHLGSGIFESTLGFHQVSSPPRRADQGEKVSGVKLLPLINDVTLGQIIPASLNFRFLISKRG